MSFFLRLRWPLLGLILLSQSVWAEVSRDIRLTATQVKSLGLEVRKGDGAAGTKQGGLPGQVVVPHEQMRLLSAPFAGLVEAIYGAPGLSVKKGQWLLRLSVPQALELRRDRQQAAAAQTLAQQSLKRDEQLFAEGLIAESRLQATRAAATQASALLTERQDALKSAGLVDRGGGLFELRAPIDGVILEQQVQVGQRVEASALLGKIGRLDTLWVDLQVPASLASGVKVGQKVDIPAKQASGSLIAVGRAVDASQSVLLRARVEQGSERLVPGQSVEVVLAGLGQGTGVRLPAGALVRQGGAQYVFVQSAGENGQQIFHPVAVELLGQSGEDVLVRTIGSSATPLASEAIVVRGTSGLKAIWTGVGRE